MNNKGSRTLLAKLILSFFIVAIIIGGWIYFSTQSIDNPQKEGMGLKTVPCEAMTTIELGDPYVGKEVAEFTTSGGTLYVKSRKFDHVGILTPKQYTEEIYIGSIDALPRWDAQRGTVSNVTQEINFDEGNYGEFKIDPGRYWLWSGGGDVIVVSCDPNGVSDPKAVK